MKKLLLVLWIAFYLGACGGGGDSKTSPVEEKVSLKFKVGSASKSQNAKGQRSIENVHVVLLESGKEISAVLDGEFYVVEVGKNENVHVRAKIINGKGNEIFFERILKAEKSSELSVDENSTKVVALLISSSNENNLDIDLFLKENKEVIAELDETVRKIETFDFIRDEVSATSDVQIAGNQLTQAIALLSRLQAVLDKVQERLDLFENGTNVALDGLDKSDFKDLESKIDNQRLAQHILNANSGRPATASSESANADDFSIAVSDSGDVVVKNNSDSVTLSRVITQKMVFGTVESKTESGVIVAQYSNTESSAEVLFDLSNKVHEATLKALSMGDYVSITLKNDESESGLLLADEIYASGSASGILLEKTDETVTIENKEGSTTYNLALLYFERIAYDADATGGTTDSKGKKALDTNEASVEVDSSLLIEVGGDDKGEIDLPVELTSNGDSEGNAGEVTTTNVAPSIDVWHPVYDIEIGDTVMLHWSLVNGEKLVYQMYPLVQRNAPKYFYGEAKLTGTQDEIMIGDDVIVIDRKTNIYPENKSILSGSLLYVEAKLNDNNQLVARYISISANYYFSVSGTVESVDTNDFKIGLLGSVFEVSKDAYLGVKRSDIKVGSAVSIGGAIYADKKIVIESVYPAWREGSFVEGNIQEINADYAVIGGVKVFLANLSEDDLSGGDVAVDEDVKISFVNSSGSVSTSLVPVDKKKLSVGDYAVFSVEMTEAGLFAVKLNPTDDIYYITPIDDGGVLVSDGE